MNCKPGDLAVCISADAAKADRIGCIVHVIDPYHGPGKGDWIVEWRGTHYRACDSNLRPIRDPGEDARDETLVWAGKPRELFDPQQMEQTA